MLEELAKAFMAQGLVGASCVVMALVIRKLYIDLKVERAESAERILALQKELQLVQDARVGDANKTVDRIVELARSIDQSTDAVNDAIQVVRDFQRRP